MIRWRHWPEDGMWTLVMTFPDLPNVHCYGSGWSKKEAAKGAVANWRANQQMFNRIERIAA